MSELSGPAMRETSRRPPSLTACRLVLVDGELPADTLLAPADNHRAGLLETLLRVVAPRRSCVVVDPVLCPFSGAVPTAARAPGRWRPRNSIGRAPVACSGSRVRVIGTTVSGPGKRPVVFVSNHSSWLDIPVLGGQLDACFVSKDEVGGWPGIGTVARLGRTVFVLARRQATRRERDVMRERLTAGRQPAAVPGGAPPRTARV